MIEKTKTAQVDGEWYHADIEEVEVENENETSAAAKMIPVYASILGFIAFYFIVKKSIKNKNDYYNRILPIAEEKIIRAIQ